MNYRWMKIKVANLQADKNVVRFSIEKQCNIHEDCFQFNGLNRAMWKWPRLTICGLDPDTVDVQISGSLNLLENAQGITYPLSHCKNACKIFNVLLQMQRSIAGLFTLEP